MFTLQFALRSNKGLCDREVFDEKCPNFFWTMYPLNLMLFRNINHFTTKDISIEKAVSVIMYHWREVFLRPYLPQTIVDAMTSRCSTVRIRLSYLRAP